MAKQLTSCGERGSSREGKKKAAFSETELDAARQLMQLSGNSDASGGGGGGMKKEEEEEEEEEGTEASSALRDAGLLFRENEDGGMARRNKRYRSIQHIYRSTKPIIDVVRAKKMRCS
ncbi:WAT1-related protein [Psidium guajava]|nr:WAT1-related protein [Psidium guajava]